MNVNDHPELEDLNNYLSNSSSAEFGSLRLHLAQCSQCRTLVDGLMGLKNISQQQTLDTLTEDQHQSINDYINGRLSNSEHNEINKFIYANPSAMKAALHLASQKSLLDRSYTSDTSTESLSNSTQSVSHYYSGIFSKLKSLITYQAPIWISVPAAAAFIALLSVNLFEQDTTQKLYNIASYQDNAVMQFRSKDNLPGIGFFAKEEHTSVNYEGLQVAVTDDKHFSLRWPAIANAVKYNLKLQVFNNGNKTLVGDITTDDTSAVISTELENIYHRYEWVLTGETSDNRVFMANGGFVINHSNTGSLR